MMCALIISSAFVSVVVLLRSGNASTRAMPSLSWLNGISKVYPFESRSNSVSTSAVSGSIP